MNAEVVNLYIEKLINYITELTKTNILMSAQLEYQERLNRSLNDKLTELEAALDKAKAKSSKKTAVESSSEF